MFFAAKKTIPNLDTFIAHMLLINAAREVARSMSGRPKKA